MSSYKLKIQEFAIKLFEVEAIKFGNYKTKVGLWTPVYCDLRVLVSYPKLLEELAELIAEKTRNVQLDIICGVPYTALPIATVLSIKEGYPMVMRRKEAKNYGTKKLIEGNFTAGDRCMIVEDIVTSGSSILETVEDLRNAGIKVTDAVVILNREQGGEEILKRNGIRIHALLTLTELVQILNDKKYIDKDASDNITKYLMNNQVDPNILEPKCNRVKMAYADRIKFTSNPVAKEVFEIMSRKQTNLCVAADLTSANDILDLARQVGPHICVFKTHVDIIEDIGKDFFKDLTYIASENNFLLMEDRKFADIGKTVELQYSKGTFHISSWAKLVTAHPIMGKSTLDGMKEMCKLVSGGVFLVAQSSTSGLINDGYTKAAIEITKDYGDIVTGFVAQNPLFLDSPGFLQLTPGVQLEVLADSLGQNYNSPEHVILQNGADIAVVGRGITRSQEPAIAAQKYRSLLWSAYEKRICKRKTIRNDE